jgi:hypothetical protein
MNKILHYIHRIISYRILIHAYTDAPAATNTQPLTSLTYQADIPLDITSQNITEQNITSNAIAALKYSHSHSQSHSAIIVQYSTVQCNAITGQSRAALISIV